MSEEKMARFSARVQGLLVRLSRPARLLLSRFKDEGAEALEECDLAHALNPRKEDEAGDVLPTPQEAHQQARAAIAELVLLGLLVPLETRSVGAPRTWWTRTSLGESVCRGVKVAEWR